MRLLLTTLATLVAVGCSFELVTPLPRDPGTTGPPPDQLANPATSISGAIYARVGGSGECLAGATVRVVVGGQLGPIITQEPCSWWDYGGGFAIRDLTPGVGVGVRASAPGYADHEETFLPGVDMPVVILLDALPPS